MRYLKLPQLVSIGIGGMVGGGIFAVLGLAVQYSDLLTPLSFLFAGLIALVTAYSYAKFSTRIISHGGTVEYIASAFRHGPFIGSVNVLFLLSYVVMISLYAYAFGAYGAALLGVPNTVWSKVLASLVILAFAGLNLRGAYVVGRTEEAIVGTKILILLLFVLIGFWSINWGKFSSLNNYDPISALVGGLLIFLAYEGFELIANASEDAYNPEDLPKAFYISVIFVIALYVLIALVVVGSLDPSVVVKARDYALAVAAEPFLGKLGFFLIGIAALLSTASAINATLYGSSRIAYSLIKNGSLPGVWVGHWGDLVEGLVFVTVLSLILTNFGGLSQISFLGSSGFLFIFGLVNLAAYLKSDEIGANALLTALGSALCFLSLFILSYKISQTHPGSITLLLSAFVLAYLFEVVYRNIRPRRIKLIGWRE